MTHELPQLPEATPPLPTRSGFAYEKIRKWIVNGNFRAGQKLDQEWLASTLSVSRTPLRQALMRLDAEGLVENRPYHGSVVAPLTLQRLDDIYSTRGAIEAMLAHEATRQCSQEAVAAASHFLAAAQESGELHGGDFVDRDRRFHLAIYACSGFEIALDVAKRLLVMSERYSRVYAQRETDRRQSEVEHSEIFKAFRDGRAGDAKDLTKRHIERGRVVLAGVVAATEQADDHDDRS